GELDELQREIAAIAERGGGFDEIRTAVLGGGEPAQILAGSVEGRPRLTEPWFC
ncbi:MAG: hypothetical protein QOG63_1491, partial [Thermoleophilaceae bacterium]|nr:hypothetical protein [Thermoleophilaceae bacterium]